MLQKSLSITCAVNCENRAAGFTTGSAEQPMRFNSSATVQCHASQELLFFWFWQSVRVILVLLTIHKREHLHSYNAVLKGLPASLELHIL